MNIMNILIKNKEVMIQKSRNLKKKYELLEINLNYFQAII